jgi:ribosome-associated protein
MRIDPSELAFEFFRSSGPGGQNVNKVSTAVRLRFDVTHSPSLPDDVKARLVRLAGSKVTDRGVLCIEARRFRTQGQNRQDALDRLEAMIERAWKRPIERRATRPTKASRERRLKAKARQSLAKQRRRSTEGDA